MVMSLFAHQGGWDEILMVLAPIGLLALVLRMAQRRAVRLGETPPTVVSLTDPTDGESSLPPGDIRPDR